MRPLPDRDAEWLEADGLGGFAMGTVGGARTRRYHALLCAATEPPAGRMVLVNGVEAWVDGPFGTVALSSQHYAPDVVFPDGAERLRGFTIEPWPTWTFALPDGRRVVQELVVRRGVAGALLAWRCDGDAGDLRVRVRPLCSGRDYHALHRENAAMRTAPVDVDGALVWRPYDGVPAIAVRASGRFAQAPEWYRRFRYAEETARGLDDVEDCWSPGEFTLPLADATLALATTPGDARLVADARAVEGPRRAAFASPLHRAADAYVVRRGAGSTIVAGYPWFTDWGRDTCIALRGLCLATRRFDDARAILGAWADAVSDGMLPNRFPDRGGVPEYNSVDAALWFVVAVHELCTADAALPAATARRLRDAVQAVLDGHARGTRHGIRVDDDGLLAAGEPGWQLTWMDARAAGREVTPRTGKPVEVQALWLTALRIGAADDARWARLAVRGRASFAQRFWNDAAGCCVDVVDVDHRPGTVDAAVRPNQILAVGGLPWPLLDGERARRVVEVVERRLWTPLGLRSLAPDDPAYVGRYAGPPEVRDAAYHQGTVWPWLLGPFVEAWLRVVGDGPESRHEARVRFLAPLMAHLDEAGLGHVSEIADGDAPHVPRGCPFQAWSVGEALRLAEVVLAERPDARGAGCAVPAVAAAARRTQPC